MPALMRRLVGMPASWSLIAIADHRRHALRLLAHPDRLHSDRGPGLHAGDVQLPDGASLDRTQKVLDRVSEHRARRRPASTRSSPSPASRALDNNASLSNGGVAYIILKDWAVRGKKEGLLPMLDSLNKAMEPIEEATVRVLPPPPIQGIGFAAGFTMQVELRDDSYDYAKLRAWSTPPSATPLRNRASGWC